MKRALAIVVIAVVARAGADVVQLPVSVQNALTTIDSVPTQGQLDTAFQGTDAQTATGLVTIAQDSTADVGIRLRAIHALVHFCPAISLTNPACDASSPAHTTLTTLVQAAPIPQTGSNLLVLRAAIEALGPLRVPADYAVLAPLLDHDSRDIRAATAIALRDLCDTDAISDLRTRYQHETVPQVQLAISAALRALAQAPNCQ